MPPDYTQPTLTHQIDGYAYTSTKLPAMQSWVLLARCIQALGDRGMRAAVMRNAHGFAELAPQLVLGAGEVNFYGALLQISYGIQQDPTLPRDILAQVKVDRFRPANMSGGPLSSGDMFDAHFTGELPHLMRVLEFAAKHNFLGFTLGPRWTSGARTSEETQKAGSSDSQTPSEGSSTQPSPDGSPG